MAALALAVGFALGAPADLDTGFNGSGKRVIDYAGSDGAQALAVQADGKIVVVGYGGGNTALAVTRLNPDGTFDTGFDLDGTSGFDFGGDDAGYGVALQPDGRIVAVGRTSVGNNGAVARFNPDGSLDTGFNGTGTRTIDYGGLDLARDVAVQPDGKIVVVGGGGSNTALAVTRLNPDGFFDASFDLDGTGGFDLGQSESGYGLALQPDGKIVVAGHTVSLSVDDGFVGRLKADGSPDTEFGANGVRVIDYGGADAALDVALQPDGKVVVAGRGGSNTALTVTRLNPDGSFDTSFDLDGTGGADFGGFDAGFAVAVQRDGKIVAVGTTSTTPADGNFAVVRLQPGGALDTTFDLDGMRTIDFGASDEGYALALQPNGGIVVAGHTDLGSNGAVARLEGDPPPPGGGGAPGGPGGPGGRSAVPRCGGKVATIVGTARRDVLTGTRRADVIVGLGGNDLVRAGRGNDLVCGGAGADRILGQAGTDRLLGGAGRDRLLGGVGRDRCVGGDGLDRATCEVRRSAAPPLSSRRRAGARGTAAPG